MLVHKLQQTETQSSLTRRLIPVVIERMSTLQGWTRRQYLLHVQTGSQAQLIECIDFRFQIHELKVLKHHNIVFWMTSSRDKAHLPSVLQQKSKIGLVSSCSGETVQMPLPHVPEKIQNCKPAISEPTERSSVRKSTVE